MDLLELLHHPRGGGAYLEAHDAGLHPSYHRWYHLHLSGTLSAGGRADSTLCLATDLVEPRADELLLCLPHPLPHPRLPLGGGEGTSATSLRLR